MDNDLRLIVERPDLDGTRASEVKVHIDNALSGLIRIERPAGPVEYTLKPLQELYGTGRTEGPINPVDPNYTALLLPIEEEITRYYAENPRLTDGGVLLALKPLAMSPEAPVTDELARRVQLALRLALSLNDYSRHEVRQGLRQVVKSIERHNQLAGNRGYLEFISQFLGGGMGL